MRLALLAAFVSTSLAQRPDPGPTPRPDPARDAALARIAPLTTGEREDDHPALASRGGVAWVAWVSYSETEHSTHIFARAWRNNAWQPAERITEAPGDYHKPAIAIDEQGAVWVAWAAQVTGNWDLYGRKRAAAGGWSRLERWTTDPGPDLLPGLAAGGGRVMLVWQGFRNGGLDILYRVARGNGFSAEAAVSTNKANDWEPVVAAADDGAFHVAWDSFRGDYDVMLRSLRGDQWSEEIAVAQSARLENHASLSMDARGRLWIGFEIGPENWATDSADGGLRARRDIGLACLENGKLLRATAAEAALATLAGQRGLQAPLPFAGRDGRLRLLFRQPINNNWLRAGITTWDGNRWSEAEFLPHSDGRIDQRLVAAPAGENMLAVYPAGSSHNIIYARAFDAPPAASQDPTPPLAASSTAAAKPAPAPPRRHSFAGYQLVWGDLHRHTDISEDAGIIDGSLMDAMRYALDGGGLDFLGVTDHTRYLPRRYNLWRIQQIADLFYRRGVFAPVHAYERSQYSPWGHRNIVHLDRNYTPVPASYDLGDPGVSPWGLFEALRGKRALTIPHTSAWGNKQVSWDYWDPEIERVVEIYQGLRSTYEYNGAPDPAGKAVYEKDSKNFIWDSLARKRKMGFIASSDHRSTHMSFAAVYVKNLDRESVFEGLRARRTYAATDKILVDFSIGGALMGDETTVSGVPELRVAIEGTADLARIDIIRNGTFLYTPEVSGKRAGFTFRDEQFDGSESYYYVRVIQSDKQMAWASPIWVTGRASAR